MTHNFFRYGSCTGKQRTRFTFTFGYFQQFFDSQKAPFLDPFLVLFSNFKVDRNFSWKIRFCQFFVFIILLLCRISKKKKKRFQEKLVTDVKTDWHTDARTSTNSWDLCYNGSKMSLKYMDKNLKVICFSEFQTRRWHWTKSEVFH